MAKGLHYTKPYVTEFGRTIRLYLDDHVDSRSFISANLIDSNDPTLIEEGYDDEYVVLNLLFKTMDGDMEELDVCFDVVETGGNDFILGFDVLQNFEFDREGILLEGGEVKIYTRG